MNALAMAMNLLQTLPGLLSAGIQIEGVIAGTLATLHKAQAEGRDPTNEEWDAMHQQIEAARASLSRPEAL